MTTTEEHPHRTPFWHWEDAVIFIGLYLPTLLIAVLLFKPIPLPNKAAQTLIPQFVAYAVWFAAMYAVLKLRYDRPVLQALGWFMPPRGMWSALAGGPVLAFAVALLAFAMNTPEIQMPIKDWLTEPNSLVLTAVFAVTLAPICEEIAFRGFLQPLVARSWGAAPAVILTAIPFALMHGPQNKWSWQHIVLLVLVGSVFGWTRHSTGSTAASSLMHATYNLTQLVAYLASQSKSNS